MSETQSEWVWQGFYGPKANATSAKAITDQDMRAGVWLPLRGQPPLLIDMGGTQAMFAVQTRRSNPIPTPSGLLAVDPAIVGRMVGG